VKSGLAEGDRVVVGSGSADGSASRDNRGSRRNMRMPPMF
jgi:membrane fusion protein, macrolide-specific efflux system